MRSWLRPSLRYGSTSTIPLARSVAATAAASTASSKSIVPTTSERLRGVGDERRRVGGALGPPVQVLGGGARARDAPLQAAAVEHPADLVGEQEQRRHRRGVVGLVLARVLERGRQRQELGDPALRAVQLRDPLLRGGAQQREPQAAVGAEALLRREVVGVGLRDVHRQPAGAGGGVDQDERAVGAGRPARPAPSRRSRSRCAPTRSRRRRPRRPAARRRRVGGVARLGGDHERLLAGTARRAVTAANFCENSP